MASCAPAPHEEAVLHRFLDEPEPLPPVGPTQSEAPVAMEAFRRLLDDVQTYRGSARTGADKVSQCLAVLEDLTHRDDTLSTNDTSDAAETTETPPALPGHVGPSSIGSLQHDLGTCKPCAFFHKPKLGPRAQSKGNKIGFVGQQPVEDPIALWKAVFLVHDDTALPSFSVPMTMKEMIDMVWSKVWDDLERNGYDVVQFESIDGDETFVLLKARDINHVAEFSEARARLQPSAYDRALKQANACPCDRQDEKGAFQRVVLDDGLLPGEPITSECPHHVRYSRDVADKVEEFIVPEQLRMTRRHLRSLFSLVEMEKYGVITKFMALHEWEKLQRLYERGWSSPRAMLEWPKESSSDVVEKYTGSRIAFFFHFYDLFTRWMVFPGFLSVALIIYQLCSGEHEDLMRSIVGGLICIWATVFLARHEQLSNLKKVRWGLSGDVSEVANVRRQFSDPYRGTIKESLQNLFHWLLVCLVLGGFVWVIFFLKDLRHAAHGDPTGKTIGIPNGIIIASIKYATTITIKVVDLVWTPLSTWLSKKENHRTEMDLKAAMAVKLFSVKFVIFYYPFVRFLLVQPFTTEGCPGDSGMEGCIEVLKADLKVFFVTQVISEFLEILSALAMLKWSMSSEVASKKQRAEQIASQKQGSTAEQMLSYIEVQGMLYEYDETEEIADYMQIVTNYGFIVMFGALCPSICLLCFFANFPIKKLTAFKFSYGLRRVVPQTQDGIGSWAGILRFVTFIGITLTCYVEVFVYNVSFMSIWDLSAMGPGIQLFTFVLLERAFVALKMAVEGFMGHKTVMHYRIEEYNDQVIDKLIPRAMPVMAEQRVQDSKKPIRRSLRDDQGHCSRLPMGAA